MQAAANLRYLTVNEVANQLGVTEDKIHRFIRAGDLRAIDTSLRPGVGRPRWRISPEALAAFERARSNTTTKGVAHAAG